MEVLLIEHESKRLEFHQPFAKVCNRANGSQRLVIFAAALKQGNLIALDRSPQPLKVARQFRNAQMLSPYCLVGTLEIMRAKVTE